MDLSPAASSSSSSSSPSRPSPAFHSALQSPADPPISLSPRIYVGRPSSSTRGSLLPAPMKDDDDADDDDISSKKYYYFSRNRSLDLERRIDPLLHSSRVRSCDVFIGSCSLSPSVVRFVKWLRAELEMQGVSCFVSDRNKCRDAYLHTVAKEAMDAASFGIVVLTTCSFSNPYSIEELHIFSQRKNLIPVFFGLTQAESAARDIVEKTGDVWEKRGGQLWTSYGGLEKDWRMAVDALSRADTKLEVKLHNMRDSILGALELLGTMLGRRSIMESVKRWRDLAAEEFPFPRNASFVGRLRELLELELLLFGDVEGEAEDYCIEITMGRDTDGAGSRRSGCRIVDERVAKASEDSTRKGKDPVVWKESDNEIELEGIGSRDMHANSRHGRGSRPSNLLHGKGVACVTGESGIGKTELLLEFSYRFSQRYKMILWVGGEARYLRHNYMKLLPLLGLDVAMESELYGNRHGHRSFEDMEEETIRKVRKELMRDIPFLLIIDNLEVEKDWWDGRNVMELLPRFGGETHVLISTRLPQVVNVEPLRLLYLSGAEAISLMKGSLEDLPIEDVDALMTMEEKLGRLPFGLALVGALLSELSISPSKLLESVNKMAYREHTLSNKADLVLKRNPFLVQLLDVCFSTLDHAKKPKKLATRMTRASSLFGPVAIPISMLVLAAGMTPNERRDVYLWRRCRRMASCMGMVSCARGSVSEVPAMMVRLRIARGCTKPACIYIHDIIKSYMHRIDKVGVANSVVQVIGTEGSIPEHTQHAWAACFLVFKFHTDSPVVNLSVRHLISFIQHTVLPLAMHSFKALSQWTSVLELLRLATEALEDIEDSFLAAANRSSLRPAMEINRLLYQEFALLRATLLETRARFMLRGGLYDIGEQLCKTAVNIKEVIYGWEHPETQATCQTLEKLTRIQLNF